MLSRGGLEIGVRIALGASPRALVGTIVREATKLVVISLLIGLDGALALTRILEAELFGISRIDPVTIAGVILTLEVTALLATVVAVWRASTGDPLVALRAG